VTGAGRRRSGPARERLRLGVSGAAFGLFVLTACRATTARPYFTPLPSATVAEVELDIPAATRALSETMAKDSIALKTIKENDGFIDSGWLDAKTLEHTGARPLGTDVVRVRAWVNPSKQFWSELVVEATYRAMEDPSRPERELDTPLPEDHPLQRRLGDVIRTLIEKYGDAEALKALAAPKPGEVKPDTVKVKPDTTKAKTDTTKAKTDTTKVKPDTTKAKPDTTKAKPDTTKAKPDTTKAKRDTVPI
jgi:hypothetical protein